MTITLSIPLAQFYHPLYPFTHTTFGAMPLHKAQRRSYSPRKLTFISVSWPDCSLTEKISHLLLLLHPLLVGALFM